jgi:hypothetical protein
VGNSRNIFFFGSSALPPAPLDPYLSDLWAAYGLTRLVGTYNGPALRVRRSSDNTEQDINFSAEAIDSAALLSFVGANNGFVVTWYDQSGLGNDLEQATTSRQPQIVYSGNYVPWVQWDGTDDRMTTPNSSGSPSGFTTYVGGRNRRVPQRAYDVGEYFFFHTSGGSDLFGYQNARRNPSFGPSPQTFVNIYLGNTSYASRGVGNAQTYAMVADRTKGSVGAQADLYDAGVSIAQVDQSGTSSVGTFAPGPWNFGWNGTDDTRSSRLAASSLIVYQTAHNSATVSVISPLIVYDTPVDVLDSYTTGLSGVYCLRRQLSAYAGSCLRVRRSSDAAEADIGFDGDGELDTAALLAHCGAASGYVVKWYDQSSAANDLIQATGSLQPQVVDTGAYLGFVKFDGIDDVLSQTNNSGTPTGFTAHVQCAQRGILGVQDFLNHGNTSSDFDVTVSWQAAWDTGSIVGVVLGGSGNAVPTYRTEFGDQVLSVRGDRSAGTVRGVLTIANGGGLMTINSNNDSGTKPSGTFLAKKWNIGSRLSATTPATANYKSLVLYEVAQSDELINLISGKLG